MNDQDRSVHARWAQMEVVRYDRSGKWWLEPLGTNGKRKQVSLRAAVAYAVESERERAGAIFTRLPGGRLFDHAVQRARSL
jgi:hypothetical protein